MEKDPIQKDFYAEYLQFSGGKPSAANLGSRANPGLVEISRYIKSDLVSSQKILAASYLALSGLGYLVTLLICAQNGVGFSSLSKHTASLMHNIPHPWCAILCGALFGGIPMGVAFAALNRFRRRYLLFQMWWLPVFVPVLFCLAFMVFGSGPSSFSATALTPFELVWMTAAVLTPYGIEAIAALTMRQRVVRELGT